MRTNIEIDDQLVQQAMRYSGVRTKKFAVEAGLRLDCLITTFCLDAGHALLHRDRDFDPFEKHLGLRVVHP
jgi:hypothetical protein